MLKTIVNETVDQVEINVSEIVQAVKITGDQIMAGSLTAPSFVGNLLGNVNGNVNGNLIGIISGSSVIADGVVATTQENATDNTTVATTAFVKNLIGEIPAGLSFEGTWDADTNTPDLSTATLSNGKFWIVSVSGATDLGGITDWKVV